MPTLYVENVPEDLYDALRQRAKENRRSIAAEVLTILEENIPTEKQLKRRRQLLESVKRMNARKRPNKNFPSTEEMMREDRSR